MIYLLLYLLVGAVAYFWVSNREDTPWKDNPDNDPVIWMAFMTHPLSWVLWLIWPITLPLYFAAIQEGARVRKLEAQNSKTVKEKPAEVISGSTAKVVTRMNPAGKIEIGESHFDARSEDGLIEEGAAVLVVRKDGFEVIVKKEPNQSPQTTGTSARL